MAKIPDPEDTIVAIASALGRGPRGILRLSGPKVRAVVGPIFEARTTFDFTRRGLVTGSIRLAELHSPLPCDLYFNPGPRTYTGQDIAELHTLGSLPIMEAVVAALLNAGARSAQPGEFTLRAFLAGKKDLPQAEAVLAVIEAGSEDELQKALAQLAGGVTQPLEGLREDLLNLLADVEAGLDFSEEDIQFVGKNDVLLRIGKGLAQLMNLQRQFKDRGLSQQRLRAAIVGEPNAGKSSLFNALVNDSAAIVSPLAGTTRDYLRRTIDLKGIEIELIDTAGHQTAADSLEQQAQTLGAQQAQQADWLIWCVPHTHHRPQLPESLSGLPQLLVRTKCDNGTAADGLATSVRTGLGLDALRDRLRETAEAHRRQSLAPSLSRCRHHVDACLDHLRKAHNIVLFDDPAELFALELRLALDELGAMVGAIHTEDLLGRVFSRFCIGK